MTPRAADNALVAAMAPEMRARVEPSLNFRELKQGDLIYASGETIDQIHLPVSGVLSVLTELRNGSAVETATIGCEGAAGLTSALAPVRAYGRTVAQTPTLVFSIGSDTLGRLAADCGRLRELIIGYADLVLCQAQQSTACNISHDVEQRFCRWLLTCEDRVRGSRVELTQEFLAMMLGVQRTTVSQVASQLQAAGAIRYNRGRIDILDRAQLERRSCECYAKLRTWTRSFLKEAELEPMADA